METILSEPSWTRRLCATILVTVLVLSLGAAVATAAPPSSASSPPGRETGATAPSNDDPATELPEVLVTDKNEAKEGGAESGYRHANVDLGPLGERKALDTPFSIQAVSSELLRNQDAETFSEAVKYLPSVYVEGHFGLEFGPPVVRGLQGDDNAQSVRI